MTTPCVGEPSQLLTFLAECPQYWNNYLSLHPPASAFEFAVSSFHGSYRLISSERGKKDFRRRKPAPSERAADLPIVTFAAPDATLIVVAKGKSGRVPQFSRVIASPLFPFKMAAEWQEEEEEEGISSYLIISGRKNENATDDRGGEM